ncbi:hypothetical protein NON00_16505 [Roseomonas sp. GC11]|uniref:hypothetical protein n=1 Tax=Roseomonas sp. GC11 TaxID=2950546 RepID=UPI0021093F74|nr:hypothetical protein [Roseomonas sp. GC11]MCQ4161521.1 hypothetical protein [Roseomonas sp. GC11]
MPILLSEVMAVLEGHCSIEEAETLAHGLRQMKRPRVDLSGCTHLHLAVLQTLLAFRPLVAAPPEDPFLGRLIAGLPSPPED